MSQTSQLCLTTHPARQVAQGLARRSACQVRRIAARPPVRCLGTDRPVQLGSGKSSVKLSVPEYISLGLIKLNIELLEFFTEG